MNTLTWINDIIAKAGYIRCISLDEVARHEDKMQDAIVSDSKRSKRSAFIGIAEGVIAGTALAVLSLTPVGWVGWAATGIAVVASGTTASLAYASISRRRDANKLRKLTEWEDAHYRPWFEAFVGFGDYMLTVECRECLQDLIMGSRVDEKLTSKLLANWMAGVAEKPEMFSLESLSFMAAVDHIATGKNRDEALMESLFEAGGEADVVLALADTDDGKRSLALLPEWLGPKLAKSGYPYVSPVSKSLARLISDAYVDAIERGDIILVMDILMACYYVKSMQILAN